jgi:tRNA A-37 threonylcarbamoyl transferase component Bud32
MAGLESLLKGRELAGRYRIEEVIGRGGMGAVYRATDARLGRDVAVKVITASAGNDPEVRERLRARFRHEAASAARLPHHPNVVPVYDYGTDEELGLDYIVMELLRGEDLASRLQRSGPPPMAEALRILQHAARGVAVGHRAGLIHRDVKPGNVFLIRQGDDEGMQVRVLDFGIAKAMAEEEEDTASAGLTHDGRAPLSPAYASPEQLRGERRLTPASDVFSLGALGFQLLSGTRPFTEGDRNRMAAGLEVPIPSLRARNPQVPEEVEAVVRRALAPEAEQRFSQAGALADALDAPLRRLADSPLAGLVPGAAPGTAGGDDDDRTMVAGSGRSAPADADDRTMLAPPLPAGRPQPQSPASRAAGPVMAPPRRRVAVEERRGIPAYVWILLLAVVAVIGWLVAQQVNGRRAAGPVVGDTVADSVVADTVDVLDALMLNQEGLRYFNLGMYDSAQAYFERAVQQEQRNVEYRDNLAATLIRGGRYQDAASLLEQSIRIDRSYDLLYSHLADARLALGDTVSAVRALEDFVEITQSAQDRQRAMALLERLRAPTPPIVEVPGPTDVDPPSVPGPETGPPDTVRFPRPGSLRDSIRIRIP